MESQAQRRTALTLTSAGVLLGFVLWFVISATSSAGRDAEDGAVQEVAEGVPVWDVEREQVLAALTRPGGDRPRVLDLEAEPLNNPPGVEAKIIRVVYQWDGESKHEVRFFSSIVRKVGPTDVPDPGPVAGVEWRRQVRRMDREFKSRLKARIVELLTQPPK